MARLQGILCLLWCLAVLADADATLAAGATAGHSVCSFNLMGFGNRPGIKFASLSCTGGTVTVAAHKVLKEFWGQQAPSRAQGVEWSKHAACVPDPGCLLSVCEAINVVFSAPTLTALQRDHTLPGPMGMLYVSQRSRVTIRKGVFTSCSATPLAFLGTSSGLVDQANIQNITTPHGGAGMVVAQNATVLVMTSTFQSLKATQATDLGEAISANDAAHLVIVNSRFQENSAGCGGAIYAGRHARVEVASPTSKQGMPYT